MSLNLNKVIYAGRLVRDPTLSTTPNGANVSQFTIASEYVTQEDNKKTEFIDFVAWNKNAQFVHLHFTRGKPIYVEGRLQKRSYEAKDGGKRYVTEVIADVIKFVTDKGDTAPAAPSQPPDTGYTAPAEAVPVDDDDYPF